jgi:hypothetical protein
MAVPDEGLSEDSGMGGLGCCHLVMGVAVGVAGIPGPGRHVLVDPGALVGREGAADIGRQLRAGLTVLGGGRRGRTEPGEPT